MLLLGYRLLHENPVNLLAKAGVIGGPPQWSLLEIEHPTSTRVVDYGYFGRCPVLRGRFEPDGRQSRLVYGCCDCDSITIDALKQTAGQRDLALLLRATVGVGGKRPKPLHSQTVEFLEDHEALREPEFGQFKAA